MSEPNLVPSAEHTLRLVELLLAQPDGLSPQDLLLNLDLSRSSLFLLLRTLKELGYVEQNERRGRYRVGARLRAWQSSAASLPPDIISAFYHETHESTWSETLALILPAADGWLVAAQVEGAQLIRCALATGQVLPLKTGVERLFEPALNEVVRENGYSLLETPEALYLAVPVCREGGAPSAGLLVSAPAFRWTNEKYLETFLAPLRYLAAHLSYRLGAKTYAPYQIHAEDSLLRARGLERKEIHAFLKGPWPARLACVRPDGRPHVVPVWQEWNGEAFEVVAWIGSQWASYVGQTPTVSLTIDEPWPPLRRVVVQGTATPMPASELAALVQRLARRYLGQPAPASLAAQVQQAFYIQPRQMRGWQGLPGLR